MTIRAITVVAHRWAGLCSSVVLAIVGATGAVMVWPGSSLPRRAAGKLHENLAMGSIGAWLVVLATLAAVFLELTGLFLWLKKRTLAIRVTSGWKRMVTDAHYSIGAVMLVIMLILALTGAALSFVGPEDSPELRKLLMPFHTSRPFPFAVRIAYSVCSAGFLVQGVTGVLMWWNSRRRS